MGTDAIIVSRKKRIYCDIDRMYNFYNDSCRKEDMEEGVSVQAAIEVGEYNIAHPDEVSGRYNDYQTKKGLAFLRTLDKDDVVRLVPDDGRDDEYYYITYQQGRIDGEGEEHNEKKEDAVFYHPDYTDYREWDDYKETI